MGSVLTTKLAYVIWYIVNEYKKVMDRDIEKRELINICYILKEVLNLDFNYIFYHYGIESSEIEFMISTLESKGILSIKWKGDRIYEIKSSKYEDFNELKDIDISIIEKFLNHLKINDNTKDRLKVYSIYKFLDGKKGGIEKIVDTIHSFTLRSIDISDIKKYINEYDVISRILLDIKKGKYEMERYVQNGVSKNL